MRAAVVFLACGPVLACAPSRAAGERVAGLGPSRARAVSPAPTATATATGDGGRGPRGAAPSGALLRAYMQEIMGGLRYERYSCGDAMLWSIESVWRTTIPLTGEDADWIALQVTGIMPTSVTWGVRREETDGRATATFEIIRKRDGARWSGMGVVEPTTGNAARATYCVGALKSCAVLLPDLAASAGRSKQEIAVREHVYEGTALHVPDGCRLTADMPSMMEITCDTPKCSFHWIDPRSSSIDFALTGTSTTCAIGKKTVPCWINLGGSGSRLIVGEVTHDGGTSHFACNQERSDARCTCAGIPLRIR